MKGAPELAKLTRLNATPSQLLTSAVASSSASLNPTATLASQSSLRTHLSKPSTTFSTAKQPSYMANYKNFMLKQPDQSQKLAFYLQKHGKPTQQKSIDLNLPSISLIQAAKLPLSAQEAHLAKFWGKWLRGNSGGSSNTEQQEAKSSNGWGEIISSDEEEADSYDWEGMRRPTGRRASRNSSDEEYSSEEAMEDLWDDSDDDDQGGHMMPIPGI